VRHGDGVAAVAQRDRRFVAARYPSNADVLLLAVSFLHMSPPLSSWWTAFRSPLHELARLKGYARPDVAGRRFLLAGGRADGPGAGLLVRHAGLRRLAGTGLWPCVAAVSLTRAFALLSKNRCSTRISATAITPSTAIKATRRAGARSCSLRSDARCRDAAAPAFRHHLRKFFRILDQLRQVLGQLAQRPKASVARV
jgi:hypothetical protein